MIMAPILDTEDTHNNNTSLQVLGIDASTRTLTARSASTKTYTPGKGAINPDTIHNGGLLALFALLGATFVLTAIWFFFWSKNGGFHWRKGDWEEYKSTVLRRKGPDGRTLSNATKSTDLGGGSIVHPRYRDKDTGVDSMSYTYTYTDGTTVMPEKRQQQKGSLWGKKKNNWDTKSVMTAGTTWKRKLQEKANKLRKQRRDQDEEEGETSCWDAGDDDVDVLAYRNEKPARVGGMNRQADGTYHSTSDYDSSYFDLKKQHHHHQRDRHRRYNKRNDSFASDSEETLTYDSPLPSETETLHHHHSPSSSPRRPDDRRHREREHRREREARERAREDDRREREYREEQERQRRHRRDRAAAREGSPRKHHRDNRGSYTPTGHYSEPLDLSARSYQYSGVRNDKNRGAKGYHHPIPDLSKGYRRDGGVKKHRRRDSLSDSD